MKKQSNKMNRIRKGFTAVELVMVAAIIAIIAMMITPVLRKRSREAKQTICRNEMKTFATIESTVYAETGYYFRLQDLDNNARKIDTNNTSSSYNPYSQGVPYFSWNGEGLNNPAFPASLESTWEGPYIEYNEKESTKVIDGQRALALFGLTRPYFFYTEDETDDSEYGGLFSPKNLPSFGGSDDSYTDDEFPLDPWGNPYFFFGPATYANESDYAVIYDNAIIASMGPDGICGNPEPTQADENDIRRTNFGLGENNDDLTFEF